jgi:hypothetical protein
MVAAAASPAFAEDIVAYQAEGDAPASGTDARTMALDEAFANAVQTALAELVAPEVRTARKGEIDREIVARARLWVAKFSVTKDETIEDRRELTVSVRIDRDKLRARLGELNVAIRDAGATQPTNPGTDPVAPALKTATVLLRVTTPKGVQASYGQGAISDLGTILHNSLRAHGYAVRKAPASGAAARGDGDAPLSDDEADALANEAKADTMVIASATVGQAVAVRGVANTAALVTANVRIVDRKGDRKVLGSGTATAAAVGDAYAVNRALALAAADMLPPAPTKLGAASAYKGEDIPLAEPGIVLVRLPARTPMATVLLEQKYLAGAKGVRSATLRRMSPNGWVIGVATSEPIEQVARIAKKAPSSATTASVKIVGDIVEVTLSGAQ